MINKENMENRKSDRLIEPSTTKATVLTVSTKLFSELIRSENTSEIFTYVNKVLAEIIPITVEQEGIIDKFIGAGFVAFYYQDHEKAIKTALQICEVLRNTKTWSIGITYGEIMVGTVGNKDCMSTVTISEYTGISEFLQSIASKYHARILITSSYANKIEDFKKKYTHRFLGYIYIRSTQKIEKIYDVFSGDHQEDVWMKKKTRLMFEEGVRLFTSGKFEIARLHFIEVLKASRKDTAAKEYLYLCDKYIQEGQQTAKKIYIEHY